MKRLEQQIDFMREIDKLKTVQRRTYLLNGKRKENSAEHSWHAAIMAMIFSEYSNNDIDPCRVAIMLLIHDIVEIDSGDTYVYDTKMAAEQAGKEQLAAMRIFGLLPESQADKYLRLWTEFESSETNDDVFAKAMDKVMPILHNYFTGGKSWQENDVILHQVLAHKDVISKGSTQLWEYIESVLEDATTKNYLTK